LADVYRIKGVMLYDWWAHEVKRCEAKPALETYLKLRPGASDREAVRARIADLRWC
jgi:hypothetical protein